MIKKYLLAISIALSISPAIHAQFDENALNEEASYGSLGIGLGQGYGGIGFRLTANPIEHIGIFGGLGYNFLQAGWSLGIQGKLSSKRLKPVVSAMYGYNAVIVVQGADQYNKTYYGPSVGGGIELHKRDEQSYWNFELIIPARSQECKDDMKALKMNPAIEISELLPFTIGVGYHFKF